MYIRNKLHLNYNFYAIEEEEEGEEEEVEEQKKNNNKNENNNKEQWQIKQLLRYVNLSFLP